MPFLRLLEAELADQLLEAVAVLGEVDHVGRGAEDRHLRVLERRGELQRRLAAELDDDAVERALRLLDADDLEHVLGGQRLEIEPVGGVVVGRDGLGIAVDHDRLVARVGQREAGVAAAIVELDALADAVRAAAEDDHLLARRSAPPRWPARRRRAPRRSSRYRRSARRTRRRRCRSACRPGGRRAARGAPRPRPRSVPASWARRASEKPCALSRRSGPAVVGQAVRAEPASPSRRSPRAGAGTRGRCARPR